MICPSWPVFNTLITSELVSPSENPFYLFPVKSAILPVNTIHQKITSKQEKQNEQTYYVTTESVFIFPASDSEILHLKKEHKRLTF